jgi:ligand-binding sensor domain-containing protein/two-component sensor histidine kinase
MTRIRLVLSVLLCILPLDARAQQAPVTTHTTADGLPSNTINRIVKDSRGFLWFCTAEGLSRFDGYAFTNFGSDQGLPQSSVNDFLETRAGEYWIATDGGLVHFNPKGRAGSGVAAGDGSIAPAPMFTLVMPDRARPPSIALTVLREGRDGAIWAGTGDGLYRLTFRAGRSSLESVAIGMPNDNAEQRVVADVLEDASGSLWVAAPSGLYRRWPDGSSARYTRKDGLPNDYLQNLLEDHDGHLWAATLVDGFFRFSAGPSHQPPVVDRRFTVPDLPTPWVFQLLETSDHRFWIATARGLLEFFPSAADGHSFRAYTTRNGLSYFEITALSEDAGGNLWLGTNTAGAMKFALNGFTAYGERDGLRQVGTVFGDRAGNLCYRGAVLGDTRASVFEGARLDLVSTAQPAYYERIGCFDGQHFNGFQPAAMKSRYWGWVSEQIILQTRCGEWWIGTGVGLYRFPPADRLDALRTSRVRALYTTKDGLATPQVFRLFEDSRGDVWVSTIASYTNGLARWDHVSMRLIDMAGFPGVPPLKSSLPRAFGEDASGRVWVGFDDTLARYQDGAFELFTSRDGLPPGNIRTIYLDHTGRLWLASAQSGLIRVDDLGTRHPRFTTYGITQGLSSNTAVVITEDPSGRIYVGGGRGLDRLDPSTGLVKHFTTADGLAPGSFRSAFRDRDGVLWFGMTSGISRLSPPTERPAVPPPVLISGLSISGVPQLVSALGEREIALSDLAPRQNQLQIDFIGLGFSSGDALQYQYRLHAADADWSALSRQRTVTYANLAPGRYTFVVRAVNSDGIVSVNPASISFAILPPVWQRAWFMILIALVTGLMVYALYRYRVARLLDMANMRTRIATDLHDDIGANLTRIALLSEVATRRRVIDPQVAGGGAHAMLVTEEEDGPLDSIARIARESVSSMSDIVWAINPARETLLDLIRRMRQHADEIFTLRDIGLRFDASDVRPELRLGVDVRRDVLLIFKESVNNSARHSRCTSVDISCRVEGSRLVLTIADNGTGFDASLESEGQGLRSMRRRAQRLRGTLDIASGSGLGTIVTLTVPL